MAKTRKTIPIRLGYVGASHAVSGRQILPQSTRMATTRRQVMVLRPTRRGPNQTVRRALADIQKKIALHTRQGYFDLCGTQLPGSRLEQAHVSQFTGYKVCHGITLILHPATTPRSLIQYISNLDVAETWCLQDIHVNQEEGKKYD